MANDILALYKSIFAPIAFYIPLVPLTLGLFRLKTLSKAKLSVFFLVIFASIISIYSTYQSKNGINNMGSLHLLTALEFATAASFYYFIFPKVYQKRIILSVGIAFLLFTGINTLFIQPIDSYNSYARGLEPFLILTFSVAYLLFSLNSDDKDAFKNKGNLWIVIAFLFYFSCTQYLFLFENELSDVSETAVSIAFKIHYLVNIIYYSLLAKGLWSQK